jgi:rubredoxin-NAD+ reductase
VSIPFRKFVCEVCGHVYDESAGAPESGVAPGTRWEDLPEDWTCPDCGAMKADFRPLVEAAA